MRISWLFVAFLAFSACTSEPKAPDETLPEPAPERAAAEPQAAPAPAEPAEPTEPAPAAEEPAQTAEPASSAPSDVVEAPNDAKHTKSGLAWKRLQKGKGKGRPGKFDKVTIRYTGWTSDGREFDSSTRHGGELAVRLNHLIPGLSEGLKMMVPGEKRRLWVPGRLGYGEPGSNPNALPQQPLGDLVYDVELLGFEKAPEPPAPPKDVGAIPADASRSDSGLAWRVLSPGAGGDHPIDTSMMEMRFTVWDSSGDVVDSSVLRGGPETIGMGMLMPGWAEGMKMMVEGERRLFWIPEELAFRGAQGRPKGMIVVDVTLIQIRRDLHQVR